MVSAPRVVTQKVSNLKDDLGVDQSYTSDLLLFQQTKDLIFLPFLFPEASWYKDASIAYLLNTGNCSLIFLLLNHVFILQL